MSKTYANAALEIARPGLTTPQTEPIPGSGQVKMESGGYGWQVSDWVRLGRFLSYGSEGGTFYTSEQKHTADNVKALDACLKQNGQAVVEEILRYSEGNLSAKHSAVVFALAYASEKGDRETKAAVFKALPRVCRTYSQLQEWFSYQATLRGKWSVGRGRDKALERWFNEKPTADLAYQVVKYRSRHNVTTDRLMKLVRPKPPTEQHSTIYNWMRRGWAEVGENPHPEGELRQIWAYERLKATKDIKEVVRVITENRLTQEMVPTDWHGKKEVWQALLPSMPLFARLRNLGRLTSLGVLEPFSDETKRFVADITSPDYIKKARIHPWALYLAMKVYGSGKGVKGSLVWSPIQTIVAALEEAVFLSFVNVEPTGKDLLIAVDTSGSMHSYKVQHGPGKDDNNLVGCLELAALMCLVFARTESSHEIIAFDTRVHEVNVNASTSLQAAVQEFSKLGGGTNCNLPIEHLASHNRRVDGMVMLTDEQTWAGKGHVGPMWKAYGDKFNPDARMAIAQFVANGNTLCLPDDPNQMDFVGFGPEAPLVLNRFLAA